MNENVTDKKKSPRLKTVLFLVFAWILIFALLGGMTWFTNKWIVRLTPYHYERRGLEKWSSRDFFAHEVYVEDEEEETFLSSYPTGDIENNLLKIDGIEQAVVIPTYRDGKVSSLVAGLVSSLPVSDEKAEVAKIKEALKKELPEYMIPKKIRFLSDIPRTNNGKIDRKAVGEIL